MKKEMSKKSFYSLVVFGIIFLLGVVVAIAPAVTKNPGHDISEIGVPAGCSDGSILKWIESSETWSCGADEVGDILPSCLEGQVLENISGVWSCSSDFQKKMNTLTLDQESGNDISGLQVGGVNYVSIMVVQGEGYSFGYFNNGEDGQILTIEYNGPVSLDVNNHIILRDHLTTDGRGLLMNSWIYLQEKNDYATFLKGKNGWHLLEGVYQL